jgi:CubicO group peptidase (beta-lactamase class C family)
MDSNFSNNKQNWARVKQLLNKGVNENVFPGAVIKVVRDSQIVFDYATGFYSLYPVKRKISKDTIFDLASLTKVIVTTSAIMLLVQEKKIKLDEGLSTYLEVNSEDKGSITIRQLLSHSAGFSAWKPIYREVEDEEARCGVRIAGSSNARDLFLKGILDEPLAYKPGTGSIYSDLGFILLGFIIENVSGESLDKFAYNRLFRPLGMKSSFFVRHFEDKVHKKKIAATEDCKWRKRVICGEVHDENAWSLGGVAGHAGLFSSAGDLAIFAEEIINSYYGRGKIFKKGVTKGFFTKVDIPSSTWALGWDTPTEGSSTSGRYFSRQTIGHTGFTGVSLWIDLKKMLAVILLTNRIHPSRDNIKIKEFRPLIHDAVMEALGYGDRSL